MAVNGSNQLTPFADLLNSISDDINARFQSGYDNLTAPSSVGSSVDKTVIFPVAFAGQPQVFHGLYSSDSRNFSMSKLSVSNTQVVFRLYRIAGSGAATVNFDWMAII